jgi:hypothetical protein
MDLTMWREDIRECRTRTFETVVGDVQKEDGSRIVGSVVVDVCWMYRAGVQLTISSISLCNSSVNSRVVLRKVSNILFHLKDHLDTHLPC